MTRLASTLILTLLIAALFGGPAEAGTPMCTTLTLEESILTDLKLVEPSVDGSVVWAAHWNSVRRSTDYGQSWAVVKTFARGISFFQGIFVDSNDNLFISREDMGLLVKGVWAGGDSLTCTDVLTYDCASCPTGTCGGFWHMAEDSAGNLFGGEYCGELNVDTCAVVWKSSDSGDNWERVRWAEGDRHVHFCAVDPATDNLYVSIGDATNHQMILVSDDAGASFSAVYDADCWGQPISFAFTDAGRIFGSDCGSLAAKNNGIYRTADDAALKECYTFAGTEDNFVWAMTEDPNGNLIAGTVGDEHGNDLNDVRLYGSADGGLTWGTLKNFADNDDWTGVKWLSQRFDDQGYGYYVVTEDDGAGIDTYRYRVIHTPHVRLVSAVCRPPQEGRGGRGRSRGGRR